MKAWLFTGAAVLLAVSALAPAARAEGPRASSQNNWPGMTYADPGIGSAVAAPQAFAPQPAAPRYVWQEGYENGGRWHGHWTLVR